MQDATEADEAVEGDCVQVRCTLSRGTYALAQALMRLLGISFDTLVTDSIRTTAERSDISCDDAA